MTNKFDNLKVGNAPVATGSTDDFKRASGVSNFQVGEAPAAATPYVRQPEVRSVGTVQRATINGDNIEVQELGTGRHDPNTGNPGILGTAVSPSGSRQSADQVTDKSVVTVSVGGKTMTMEARSAAREGLIKRNSDGTYSEAAQSPQAQQQQQQQQQKPAEQQQQDAPAEALADVATEQALTQLVESTSAHSQLTAINAVASGEGITEAMINNLAETSGKSPAEVTQFIEKFHGAMEAQAADAVKKATGLSLQELQSLAKPEDIAAAVRQHIMERSTRGYVELANKLTADLDRTSPDEVLEACKASGITARVVGSRVVVTIPGRGQMTYAIAVKQGYLTVGR